MPVLVDDAGSTHLVDATGAVELITTAPVAPPAFEKRAKAKRAPSRWWALVALFNLGALVARRAGTSRAVGLATPNNKALAAAAPKGKKASKAPKVQKAPKNAKKL